MNGNQWKKYSVITREPWNAASAAYYVAPLFVACLYPVIFDGARVEAVSGGGIDGALLLAASAGICLALFYALSFSRIVFLAATPALFYVGAVASVYASEYSLDTDVRTAPLFFSDDAMNFLASDPANLIFIAGAFLLGAALGAVRFFCAGDSSAVRKGQVFAVVLTAAFASARYAGEKYPSYAPMPFAYLSAAGNYAAGKAAMVFSNNEREKPEAAASVSDAAVAVILTDRLSSDTASDESFFPVLRKNGARIYEIKPCLASPEAALLCAFTGADGENFQEIFEKAPLPGLFEAAGYVSSWTTLYNPAIAVGTYERSMARNFAEYEEILSETPANSADSAAVMKAKPAGEGKFTVLRITGLAPEVSSRYSAGRNRGKTAGKDAYMEYVSNLDKTVSEIVNDLKGRKAVVILAGLAGESVFGGRLLEKPDTDAKTAAAVWISPELESALKIETVGPDSALDASLFQTVAFCSGLLINDLDPDASLCRPVGSGL